MYLYTNKKASVIFTTGKESKEWLRACIAQNKANGLKKIIIRSGNEDLRANIESLIQNSRQVW